LTSRPARSILATEGRPVLRLDVDVEEVIALRKTLSDAGARPDILLASDIGALLVVVQDRARKFLRRQLKPKTGLGPISDGRVQTLQDRIFESWSDHAYPFGAAILHGIRLREAEPVTGGDDYLVEIRDGPPYRREFGDLTMLAVYSHEARLLKIVWIGPVSGLAEAKRRLRRTLDDPGGLDALLTGRARGWSLRA
jgi:hypothetical protein